MQSSSVFLRTCLALILPVAVCAGSALAEDLAPPSWRGGPLTTYQQWSFSGGPGGGAPDVVPYSNPYGTPIFSITGPATWIPTSPVPPTPSARPAVWQLNPGASGFVDVVNAQVSGFSAFEPCKHPEIAITFFGTTPLVSVVPLAGQGNFTSTLDNVLTIPLADGWTYMRFDFSLYANTSPSAEQFIITNDPGGESGGTFWIDSVIVDTQVLPAPGAAAVLGLGGLVASRRRR